MKLYYMPMSCSLASHIALEEAGADYEAVLVDLRAGENRRAEYLAVNPLGRVPALATERGVLTETVAILGYIAQSYPAARLAPLGDPFAFARAQAFNAYLASTVHPAHTHRHRPYRWADEPDAQEAMRAKAPQVVAECFELIERELLAGPWVLGEAYSICDPYLFTVASWLRWDAIDPARFPRVADHARRMRERPAVASVLRTVVAALPESATFLLESHSS